MIVKTANDMSYVRHNFTPVKNKLLNKFSNAEDHFENLLKQTNIYFVREKGNFRYETRWCYYDFYIPFFRLYIEIDGKSHESTEQKKIDKEKHEIIDWKKRFLVRLTNEEVLGLGEISLGYLIKRLCEQYSANNPNFFGFTVNEYLENLKSNIHKGTIDMLEDTGLDVDLNKNVFMFTKSTGRIYRFQNECIAKMNLTIRLNAIRKLLVDTEYKKSSIRKYVLSYTEEDCIKRVKSCMGIDLDYNGNIPISCGLESLIPIMNDMEKYRWFGIPLPGVKKFLDNIKEIGFQVNESKKKKRFTCLLNDYMYHSEKYDAKVKVRIYLRRDELSFYVIHPKQWYGTKYNIKDIPSNVHELNAFINKFISNMCLKYRLSFKNI